MSISATSSSTPASTSTSESKPAASTGGSQPASSTTAASTTTSKPAAESTVSPSAESTSGSATTAEPNLSADAARFDSNPSELASGEGTASDPEHSAEFTGVQAEAALEVTGEPVENEEVEETEEAASGAAGGGGEAAGGGDQLELPATEAELHAVLDSLQPPLQGTTALPNQDFRESVDAAFGTDSPEALRARELAVAALNPSTQELEERAGQVVDMLNNPEFQQSVDQMSALEQTHFFEHTIPAMVSTETGREWVHDVVGGLAERGLEGETSNFYANEIVELRNNPELGPTNPILDFTVGAMVGTDLALHPEGGTDRVEAIGEALNLDPAQVEAMGRPLTPGSESEDVLVAATQTASGLFGPDVEAFTTREMPNPNDPGAPAAPASQALLDQFREADLSVKTGTVLNEMHGHHLDVNPEVAKFERLTAEALEQWEAAKANPDANADLTNRAYDGYMTLLGELTNARNSAATDINYEVTSHRYVIINKLPEGTTLELANEMLNRYNAPTTAALNGQGNDPALTHGYVDMASPLDWGWTNGVPVLDKAGGHVNLYRGETEDGRAFVQNSTIGGEHPLVGHIVRTIVQDKRTGDFYVVTEGTGQGDMGHGWGPATEPARHFMNTVVGPPAFNNLDREGSAWISAQLAQQNG